MELKANTTAEEFKIIEDNKDEPDLKTAQDFVGGMVEVITCLLYTSPSPRDGLLPRMPSSA